nr:unnamed protein product [Callosobruchus analis]
MSVGPKIIKFPDTTDKKELIAAEFLKIAGFPGVLGCIDSSYIPIRTPARKVKSTYINRHDQTTLTLQGIYDGKKDFLMPLLARQAKCMMQQYSRNLL